jgi:hypothetical protein
MVPFELLQSLGVEAVTHYRVSTELWELIDRHQRPDLAEELRRSGVDDPVGAGLLPPDKPPDEPLSVLREPTAEELHAAEADAALARVAERIRAMYTRPAPRRADCGQRLVIHLRREHPAGGVEDALLWPPCGCCNCPHCWRRRLAKTLHRAAGCLLDAGPDSAAVRLGHLHFGETTWEAWEAYDKAMRRELGGGCGRLRIRRHDGTVLVIAERPWAGSHPVSPAVAVDLAADAIEQLHTAKHAYRQLGAWKGQTKSEWSLLGKMRGCIDLAEVQRQLACLGTKSHYLRKPDLATLFWRADGPEAALALLMQVCPTLANRAKRPSRSKSESPPPPTVDDGCPGEGPSPDEGPSPRDECPFGPDWWDVGPPPWGP